MWCGGGRSTAGQANSFAKKKTDAQSRKRLKESLGMGPVRGEVLRGTVGVNWKWK